MEEEIIIIIDPVEPVNGPLAAGSAWSVKFVCNGALSRQALRTAKRAIKAKLAEMGDVADED